MVQQKYMYFLQWMVRCENIPNMPNIVITLDGKQYVLTPEDYVLQVCTVIAVGSLHGR